MTKAAKVSKKPSVNRVKKAEEIRYNCVYENISKYVCRFQTRVCRSVGNKSLEVKSKSSLELMMTSPSLFVQQLKSSQFALQTRVKCSYRLELSPES